MEQAKLVDLQDNKRAKQPKFQEIKTISRKHKQNTRLVSRLNLKILEGKQNYKLKISKINTNKQFMLQYSKIIEEESEEDGISNEKD